MPINEAMLREFHHAFECVASDRPALVSSKTALLRIKLMVSELSELVEAIAAENMLEIFDGLCDLMYVTIGTAVVYGLPLQEGFEAVHRNNMTKVGADGKVLKDSAGKVIKPEGYIPVDLQSILTKAQA